MSKQRYIDTSFWSDNWIDGLTRDQRYFFLYLLTNDKTTIAGIYELPIRMIAFETGFTKDEVYDMFMALESKVTYLDGWVIMRNGIKNQNYQNDKINRGILRVLAVSPPECVKFINIPTGFDWKDQITPVQQSFLYDSSMTHTRDITLNTDLIESNTDLIELNANALDEKSSGKEKVAKLYYEAIKSLKLPVRNHNNVKAAIGKMIIEDEPESIEKYLLFMRDQFATTDWDFKPHISEALDIHAKRMQIKNTFENHLKMKKGPKVAR